MQTQSYLNEIDKDYSRNVDAVQNEIWSAAEDFRRLMDAKDTSYKSKQLPELLDMYSWFHNNFHSLEYRGAEWSTSDWGCACVHSLRDCVCSHAVLVSMLFDLDFELPESLEEAIPTACKLASSIS
jgi:hypothetical protein